MRVIVVGGSGNVGSALLRRLRGDVDDLVGVARRPPEPPHDVEWVVADIGDPGSVARLVPVLRGAAAVVHLAWLIQPSRDEPTLRRTNVDGTGHLLRAVVAAGVPTLAYASSVGAYSRGPKDHRVDESWPTEGIASSTYSRHKAEVERLLDRLEDERPELRVVRIRPGLIFQRAAASEIARFFLGPFVPVSPLRRGLLPVVPAPNRLTVQAVHADDLADAFARAVTGSARGAFNIAAEPVLDPQYLGRVLHAHPVRLPVWLAPGAVDLSWRLHLQPTDAGWIDLALGVPVMSTERARRELGWAAGRSSGEALLELLAGIRAGAGGGSPTLRPRASAPRRLVGAVRGLLPGRDGGPGSR